MINKKGLFLILITAFISGLSIFINKFGVKGIDSSLFTTLKNTTVAVFLLSILVGTKQFDMLKNLKPSQWVKLLFIGLIGGSIPFLLFFKGLTLTSAPQASFIHKNMFLIVALLSPLLLKEKLNVKYITGAIFLLLGNILLLKKAFPLSWNIGNTMILAATILWALENILSKKTLKDLPGPVVAWGRMFFGAIILITYLGFTNKLALATSLSSSQLLWVLVTSTFLFGYVYTWYSGLKIVSVTKATAILTLGAPITTLLSLTTGQTVSVYQIIGIISFVFGISVISGFDMSKKLLLNLRKTDI